MYSINRKSEYYSPAIEVISVAPQQVLCASTGTGNNSEDPETGAGF